MNVTTARATLVPPFRFGDTEQIKAIRVVEAAERIAEIRRELKLLRVWCDRCDGGGYSDCPECGNESLCRFCDGRGWTKEPMEAVALVEELKTLRKQFPGACE